MKLAAALAASYLLSLICEYAPEQYRIPCHVGSEVVATFLGGH